MKATVEFKLTNTVDIHASEAIELPDWARHASVELPATIVTGTVGVDFIKKADVTAAKLVADQDTDWNDVQVAIDSVGNLAVFYDGTGGLVVDISKFIAGLGQGHIRMQAAGNQNAVTQWYIHFTD